MPRCFDGARAPARIRPAAALALLACAIIALGCAEERPPINQVQPNALDKSMFVDSEWYMLQTVIDTQALSTLTFVGQSTELEKVVWEIQEDVLIARQKIQHIDNIEDGAIAGDGATLTGVVGIYAVESHFDIRRDYNPTTGEELNIIRENTTDRPWYERTHFRIDWSRNLVSSESLNFTSAFAGVLLEPVNYFIQDPDHPLAPHFEQGDDGQLTYFDIVNKYFASPEALTLSSGDAVATCFLSFSGNMPCEPTEVSVRSSFMRVEPDRDYQPQIFTSDHMTRAGFFLTWRDQYDPDYGVLSGQRLRLANRHNLWEVSHQRNEQGDFVSCAQTSDCSGFGPSSVCDTAVAQARQLSAGQCTVPYRERTVKPIVYHLSAEFPDDLVTDAQAFASGWNETFRETVGSLRQLECEAEGGDAAACASERDRPDAERIFVLCNSPVTEADPEVCGPVGTTPRIGDVRYNHVAWVSEVVESGPLGYGPSFADPETGEIVSAAAYVYGARVVKLSAYARDLLALINDDLDESDLTSNGSFAAWVNDVRSGRAYEPKAREADNHTVPIDGWNAVEVNQGMSFDWLHEVVDQTLPGAPVTRENAVARFEEEKARVIDAVGELHLGDQARANASLLKDTDVEHLMVTEDMRLAAGLSPLDPVSDTDLERASPLRGMSLDRQREIDELRRQTMNRPNSCVLNNDFIDEGLFGLVQDINRAASSDGRLTWYGVEHDVAIRDAEGVSRGIDYEAVKSMLRHPIFNAVTAHEVGHTLGLRHNFSGSYDSLNYNHRYWELRNDGNMAPRAWDPMTGQEIEGRIREFQYSTVMDYGNNFVVTDAEGVGHYDRAAIKLGYGDLVEVFESADESNKALIAQIGALQSFGWPGAIDLLNWSPDTPLVSVPYTRIPELLGGIDRLEQRADVPLSSLQADPMLARSVGVYNGVYDPAGRLAVPYRYCGDEFVDYEPTCLRYDAGADEYETLTSITDTYWNYYLMNNFMRQRIEFDPDTVANTVYSRYFAKLENANLYYTLYRGMLQSYGADDDFYTRPDGFGAYTLGMGASYGILTRVLGTPSPGCHERVTLLDDSLLYTPGYSSTCSSGFQSLNIDDFDGRELRTGYSLGPDSSFWFLTRAGYFMDKVLALQILTDPGARVLGQDTNADIRRFQVSFYTTYQEPIQEILRGLASRDWTPFAPRYTSTGLVYPGVTEQLSGTMDGVPVDPNLSFALELYSMVFGMAYLPRTFDYRFIDRGRLFVRGAAESVDLNLPDGATPIEFLDEASGLTYVAPSYPDADGRETGIAASVLLYAQTLKDADETAALNAWMANVNVLRRLTYVMGFGGDDSLYL